MVYRSPGGASGPTEPVNQGTLDELVRLLKRCDGVLHETDGPTVRAMYGHGVVFARVELSALGRIGPAVACEDDGVDRSPRGRVNSYLYRRGMGIVAISTPNKTNTKADVWFGRPGDVE
jgi:hypothetical protein